MSMTKKEQAIHNFWEFHNSKFQNLYPSFPINKRLENIINLVHAIDDADREERGVAFMQEVEFCNHCKHFFAGYCRYGLAKKVDGSRFPPSWCPRRKENRK